LTAQSVETTDIFRSAFFLCHGGNHAGINIKDNGRRVATFVIQGDNLERLDKEYRNGEALVNPVQFRESLTHLRDILFDRLRQYDTGENRYDRKRANRGHQAGH
jgi:hypothetical protein